MICIEINQVNDEEVSKICKANGWNIKKTFWDEDCICVDGTIEQTKRPKGWEISNGLFNKVELGKYNLYCYWPYRKSFAEKVIKAFGFKSNCPNHEDKNKGI